MSLALPTLTLLYLLAPGIVFRRFYYTGEFSAEYFKATFSELLFSTVFHSFIINILCYATVMCYHPMDVDIFAILISGTDKSGEVGTALSNLYTNKRKILLFLLFTTSVGAFGGLGTKFIVRKLKLDRRHRIFRFANKWHYLLSGEILDFPRFPGRSKDIHLRYVDILVDSNAGPIIYSGVIKDYILNKEGGLDSIYLSEAKRRYLKDDHHDRSTDNADDGISQMTSSNPYYFLPGNLFVVPFEQIKNIHITYYSAHAQSMVKKKETEQSILPP